MPVHAAFSDDYFEAQQRFIGTATRLEFPLEYYVHPSVASDEGPVQTCVAVQGSEEASHVVFVSSGVHGAELTAGSGIQCDLMERYKQALSADTKVVWIHAVNPAGCAIITRTDENNVDNNRNMVDFTKRLPPNPDYEELHADICAPAIEGPAWEKANQAIAEYVRQGGDAALTQKVLKGQYTIPMGLFYGGTQPSWSNQTLTDIVKSHASRAQKATILDLHTGVGPCGELELMDLSKTPAEQAEWNLIRGFMCDVLDQLDLSILPIKLILEFGTVPFARVLDAHRRDNWLKRNRDKAAPELTKRIQQELKDCLFVDTLEWGEALLIQSRNTFETYVLQKS